MPNAINKIVFNGETLIDLTGDTITAAALASGYTAHDKSGATITGTSTKDVTSTDATASVDEILYGETAYARGAKLTGTMPNNGSVTLEISTKAASLTIPQGYHDGAGYAAISATEQAKIIPTNILSGVSILGVTGTVSPSSDVTAQSKTVTPSASAQTITPDSGYSYLSQVIVNAIPVVYSTNSAGGQTVTIG